jgi:DNA polymerase-3 subunit delta'
LLKIHVFARQGNISTVMNFDTIIGHQQQIKILKSAISQQRIAHAYLFDGPTGIGKKLVAHALACAFLCDTGCGCGSCSSCTTMAAGSHPDFHLLQPDGDSIKIDQIRILQSQLALRSFAGRGKACLIDNAELMTREAANALLKTLEEPTAGTLIIVISSQPESLLETIRSRCQRLRFSRLPRQQLARHLANDLTFSADAALVLAAVADGSFEKALGQHQDLYLKKRAGLIQSLSALSSTSSIQTFELAQTLKAEKDLIGEILNIFDIYLRDLLLYQHGQPEDQLINQDLLPLIQQQSCKLSTPQLITKLKAVAQTRSYLSRNVNLHLALDHMLLQIAHA